MWGGKRWRETRTSTVCSDREMTSGHPEASALSDCFGKPRAHLMIPAWSCPVGFFYPGLRMVNDNRLVNYCASRRRNTSDVLLLMKKIHEKKANEVKVQDYKPMYAMYCCWNIFFYFDGAAPLICWYHRKLK